MEEFDYRNLEKIKNEWVKYEGYFREDVKEGQGVLSISNGECFRGQFENDQPHGRGEFRNVRGESIGGYWLMGALNIIE